MFKNPLRVLLFAGGIAVAGAALAYVTGALDRFFPGQQTVIASLPPSGVLSTSVAPDAGKPAATEEKSAPAAEETAPAADNGVIVPSFDLVRVEPDGSMVVAGHAAPSSMVELVTGSTVLGTAQAGPQGDFAIVLDKPLSAGDYQFVLRSTAPGNVVSTSIETATVSVPDSTSGEVLVLVEAPGKPSELISVPSGEGKKPEEATEVASAGTGTAPAGDEAAKAESKGTESKDEVATTEGEASEAAKAEDKAQVPAEAGNAQASAAVTNDSAAETDEVKEETASAEAPASQPGEHEPAKQQASPFVVVEAVEIEGRQVFVAGSAPVGGTVRVYANETLLGQATVSAGGRFLVQTEIDLPVGDYIIRADLLDAAGVTVIARAAVPFSREPGESVAAVASEPDAPKPEPATATQETAPATAEAAATGDQAAAETKPADATQAPAASPQAQPEAGKEASTEIASAEPAKGDAAPAAATESAAAPAEEPKQEVAEVTSPKLKSVKGAVIIRRGDNLWRISRRVYGHGIRYTTIYLANQDQISDPNRIWPGQVFAVPGNTDQGEEADMSAIGNQATTIPAEASE